MKWSKETKAYMWANYYSEDGKWMAYDKEELVKGGSRKKVYNPKTKKMENLDCYKHYWILVNLETNETISNFKTLKAAKEYAEAQ